MSALINASAPTTVRTGPPINRIASTADSIRHVPNSSPTAIAGFGTPWRHASTNAHDEKGTYKSAAV